MQDSFVHKGKRKILVEYLREKIGISDQETFNSRKICALNCLIGLDPTNAMPQTTQYRYLKNILFIFM